MMRMVKICLITLLGLEVLAIITHFNELLKYTGSVFASFIPVIVMLLVMVWIIKKIF